MTDVVTPDQERVSAERRRLVIALAVLIALLVGAGILWATTRGAGRTSSSEALVPDVATVVYEVEGDGAYFDLTAETPTGTTQATPDLPLRLDTGEPMTHEFQRGAFVYVAAQSKDGRVITCRITVDGTVVAENTSTGKFGIATCKGTA